MGGFFYSSKDAADIKGALEKNRKQFEQSGFPPPVTFDTESYSIDYYPKIGSSVKNCIRYDNGDFIFVVGTFLYKGHIGIDALRLFYDQENHLKELLGSRGHFVIVLRKKGQTQLFSDPIGSYEVFLTEGAQCVTTSFLAAARISDHCTINTQEMYEYVFNGVSLGDTTLFAEIRRLGFREGMKLDPTPTITANKAIEIVPGEQQLPFSKSVDYNLQGLLKYTTELGKLFGNNIKLALSGGYDSRFLLALFRRSGIAPHVFVYGSPSDLDVAAAQRICDAEGITLHHLDKAKLRSVSAEDYAETVRTNFLREDALPSGGIFTSGAELTARLERNEAGALHVNGGGGEIFRNFFNLLDRSLTLRQFVWIFYSRFDPSQCSNRFNPTSYENAISKKITALLGIKGGRLPRRQIECLYPYFRCRSWFGRENSINNRWGYSVLPFFDYETVHEALRVPVRYKYFGNFESQMIRRADPTLARHLSNYGHSFAENAPFSVLAKELSTYLRPAWLRRYSFRVRQALTKPRARPPLLSAPYLSRVIDTTFPYMSPYFKIDKVASDLHFARICTLEYMCRELSAR